MSVNSSPPADIESLYAQYHGWLVGWLTRRLRNTSHASDLAQDTFVRILKTQNHGLDLGLR